MKKCFISELKAKEQRVKKKEYAGFSTRFLAQVIDIIAIFVISAIPYIGKIIGLFYETIFIGLLGTTPGKMAFGLVVVDENGRYPIGLLRAFLRFIGKIISGIILCIGFLLIIVDDKKRGLHDKVANTYVVYK
ncbi:MAG: RDD family protein [Candidatus Parvarchaeota archaeon]|nr:RDD family protein [Candidatus Jingweiarchaeum tengchongense]MCW1297777.1 RDD family protein [Candidatus Jingweiarchaeum tengchongense]MCW1299787.1 RDD family protein [Candidatus Jingweiarchaeum tengchongense]MCW1304242.1 RDD family protein [Candidatus Jingweiarchaeum tengchongense]MCW1305270.1 RDD family protein [Candidatus Jingweiarchaeum tengchongense]